MPREAVAELGFESRTPAPRGRAWCLSLLTEGHGKVSNGEERWSDCSDSQDHFGTSSTNTQQLSLQDLNVYYTQHGAGSGRRLGVKGRSEWRPLGWAPWGSGQEGRCPEAENPSLSGDRLGLAGTHGQEGAPKEMPVLKLP